MSTYTSEIPPRVQMACSNCRQRKVKCITQSEKTVCLRCQHNGLLCEYVATERQARSKDSAPFEHSTSESGNTGAAQATSYHNHGPSPTYGTKNPPEGAKPPYMYSGAPLMPMAHPPPINPQASSLYRPPHQRQSPLHASFPHQPGPPTPYTSNMRTPNVPSVPTQPTQQHPYPSPSHNPAGYPMQYEYNSNYDWNASNPVASVRQDLVTVEGIARELVRKDTYDVKFSHACGKICKLKGTRK
ncbi:hypothetical protein B0H11DRAFT_2385945 [Mycena galericulata]|nr:hypothetical protein B0H11DRAFT_2385945 [Mycena galericulata]